MSGLDLERNETLNPETILKNVQSFCNKHASECPDIVMRVLTLLISHYDVPDKNYQDFLKKIRNSPQHVEALQMVRNTMLNQGGDDAQQKAKKMKTRLRPVLDERAKQEYR